MPNRRSPKKLEEKIARQYVYKHSVTAHRNNDPNEVRERIFTGKEKDLTEHVLVEMQGEQRQGIIPDYPTGLVFTDSRGEGFFDVHL